jgi:BON domain
MKIVHALVALGLAVSPALLAQTAAQSPTTPPYSTPPTFPEPSPTDKSVPEPKPGATMPPDTKAPAPHGTSANRDIEAQIEHKISRTPELANSHVTASVDPEKVTVTGSVPDEAAHKTAVQIVQMYAGNRDIVDQLKIRSQ